LPIYKSLADFSKECTAWNAGIQKTMVAGVNAAAFITKKSVISSAEQQRWPTRTVRGRRRPVVIVRYDIASSGNNPTALVALRNGHMYEAGAQAHEIKPRRRSRARAVTTPYGMFARVEHPGFEGRPFWRRGVNEAAPLVTKAFGNAVSQSVLKTFTKGR